MLLVLIGFQSHGKQQFSEQKPGNVLGKRLTLQSKILGEDKELYISLPPDYDETVHAYPVVFVLEAEFLFNITQSITHILTLRSEMPASIIVGVTNGGPNKRGELTLPTQGGRVYDHLRFFRHELIPYVEENYRVNDHHTIMGLSPTTGFVLEAFWSEPDLFSAYISLCTHLGWNPRKNVTMTDKLIEAIKDPEHPRSSIYLARADGDLEWNQFAKITFEAAEQKLNGVSQENVRFQLEALEQEEHYAMAPVGIRNAFRFIYPEGTSMFLGYRDSEQIAKDVKAHYDKISKAYGFDVYPVNFGDPHSDSILGFVKYLTRFKKSDQAIDLIELGINYYPNSPDLYMRLAELYQEAGNVQKAVTFAEKSLSLARKYQPGKSSVLREKLNQIKN